MLPNEWHGRSARDSISTTTCSASATAGMNSPAVCAVVRTVTSCPGTGVTTASAQSRPGRHAVASPVSANVTAPNSTRALMASVPSSSSGTNSSVSTRFSCAPLSTTSTSARPSWRPATRNRMRYVHAVLRLNALVRQLTMYSWFTKSTRTVSEPGPVVVVKVMGSLAPQAVPAGSSVISTTGESVPSNVPVKVGWFVTGGSPYKGG